jgi:sugar lactone lactonase YvrE
MTAPRTIARGMAYPECPRWHAGHLWLSDQHGGQVVCLTPEGAEVERFAVPGGPSGLGWLPGGDLLVVSMEERALYRRRSGRLERHADLSGLHAFHSNDMVVDAAGRAYVGNIGFDFNAGETPAVANLALVGPDGAVSLAAEGLMCPNGTVISPDGRTLVVAESLAHRLTAFDVGPDGSLSGRRVFAEVPGHVPDGICLDAEGAIWAASPYEGAVIRVSAEGGIVARIGTPGANPYACILGGAGRRDLYICCAPDHDPKRTVALMGGRIDVVRVAVPGAGRP